MFVRRDCLDLAALYDEGEEVVGQVRGVTTDVSLYGHEQHRNIPTFSKKYNDKSFHSLMALCSCGS